MINQHQLSNRQARPSSAGDEHLEFLRTSLWPQEAWDIDLLERFADGKVDRVELGLDGGELETIGVGGVDGHAYT